MRAQFAKWEREGRRVGMRLRERLVAVWGGRGAAAAERGEREGEVRERE